MFLLIIFVDYICNFQLIKVCFCNYEVEVIVHKHTDTRAADAFEIIFEIKISIVVTAIFSLSDSSLETAFSIFLWLNARLFVLLAMGKFYNKTSNIMSKINILRKLQVETKSLYIRKRLTLTLRDTWQMKIRVILLWAPRFFKLGAQISMYNSQIFWFSWKVYPWDEMFLANQVPCHPEIPCYW